MVGASTVRTPALRRMVAEPSRAGLCWRVEVGQTRSARYGMAVAALQFRVQLLGLRPGRTPDRP